MSNAGITIADFYAWNPSIGSSCTNLWLNTSYCVLADSTSTTTTPPPSSTTTSTSTTTTTTTTTDPGCANVTPPGATQSGIPCTCNKYVMQKTDVYCYDMAVAAGITLQQLYDWNPALNGDCSGLWVGYAYCVGVI
ncbi:hypothetical protein BDV12DRAFT_36740 [Aspergillus spectabilis]